MSRCGPRAPRPFRNTGRVFPVDVRKGNVRIIEVVVRRETLAETTYWVEYLCCGTREVWTHERLRKRVGQADTLCKSCRALGQPAKDLQVGVTIATGPMRGYWGFLGKMGPRGGP